MELNYHIVDVFTDKPFEGNPLAVLSDASALDTNDMQNIAREFNLSETSFIQPAKSQPGSTRVRIFTPTSEMDFAGHPTIGTAYVLRSLGLIPSSSRTFALEENVGLVALRTDDDGLLWLTTPAIREIASIPRDLGAGLLSLTEGDLSPDVPCEILSAGNPTLIIPLRDKQAVDRAEVNVALLKALHEASPAAVLFPFTPMSTGAYSRMFAPHLGVAEDPATGSSTGPLAYFMIKHGLQSKRSGSRFISEQGTKMGRRSLLHVKINIRDGREDIEIGGQVAPVASGTLTIPTHPT